MTTEQITKSGIPLLFGDNAKREAGKVHEEYHAPCGCAFHERPRPHWHPCLIHAGADDNEFRRIMVAAHLRDREKGLTVEFHCVGVGQDCGAPLTAANIYRCGDCGQTYCLPCLRKHFTAHAKLTTKPANPQPRAGNDKTLAAPAASDSGEVRESMARLFQHADALCLGWMERDLKVVAAALRAAPQAPDNAVAINAELLKYGEVLVLDGELVPRHEWHAAPQSGQAPQGERPCRDCDGHYACPKCKGTGFVAAPDAEQRVREIADLIEPWTTHCDYRAEPDLRKALSLCNELIKERTK